MFVVLTSEGILLISANLINNEHLLIKILERENP